MHSTAQIGLRLIQALLNAPTADDPRLPGIVILNYEAAKIDQELAKLPNLQETDSIIRRLIDQLKSLKTTSAQEQASLFENQVRDTKKLEEYTTSKEKLIKKYKDSQDKLLQSLKGLFKKSDDKPNSLKSNTQLRDLKEELKALAVEVTLQKQKGIPEQQRLKHIQSQVYVTLPPTQQASFEPPTPR